MIAVYRKENELLRFRLEAAETELTFHTVIEDMFNNNQPSQLTNEDVVKELEDKITKLQENLPVVSQEYDEIIKRLSDENSSLKEKLMAAVNKQTKPLLVELELRERINQNLIAEIKDSR